MLIDAIKPPTFDQIKVNAKVAEDEYEVAFACWYPQMGGYVGKCVVIFSKLTEDSRPPCFTALVWHDGEFPFGEDHDPVCLHHCSARQFNEFGDLVDKLQREHVQQLGDEVKPNVAVTPETVAAVVRRLHETSERAPDVRAVQMRLVHQELFDELLRVTGVGRKSVEEG